MLLGKVKLNISFNPMTVRKKKPKQIHTLLYETVLPGIPQPVHSPGIHNLQLEQQKVGIKSCVDFYWEVSSCLVKKSELQLFPPHLGSLVLLFVRSQISFECC